MVENVNENYEAGRNSFECKTKIIGSTPADTLDPEVVVPLKYLSTF